MKIQIVLRSVSVSLAFIYLAACSPPQTSSSSAAPAPSIDVCSSCGVVQSISPVVQAGGRTGAGAVIGAVVGGVAGNQVGGGTGRDVATVAGAVGGAILGDNIEKNRNTTTEYDIVINMQDGSQQRITMQDPGSISPGSAVYVRDGNITLR